MAPGNNQYMLAGNRVSIPAVSSAMFALAEGTPDARRLHSSSSRRDLTVGATLQARSTRTQPRLACRRTLGATCALARHS